MEKSEIIVLVKEWIKGFVIGLNLCPFAKSPYTAGKIKYIVSAFETDDQFLRSFEIEIVDLEKSGYSTSLIIIPEPKVSFIEYLRIYDLCVNKLEECGADKDFQLASFHPDYQFADTDYSDQSNFTNRSPFPIIHILRTKEVADAIDSFGDTTLIYKRNVEVLENLSAAALKSHIKT